MKENNLYPKHLLDPIRRDVAMSFLIGEMKNK